nr:hypothetical protein [Tanacetum cinerariifolium]
MNETTTGSSTLNHNSLGESMGKSTINLSVEKVADVEDGFWLNKDAMPSHIRSVFNVTGCKEAIRKDYYEDEINANSKDHGSTSDLKDSAWNDPKVHGMKQSFLNVVTNDKPKEKVNFRSLFNKEEVDKSDFVLLIEAIFAAQNKFANSLVGYFVGKSVAFPLVKNYVTNTWGKFGFQRVIKRLSWLCPLLMVMVILRNVSGSNTNGKLCCAWTAIAPEQCPKRADLSVKIRKEANDMAAKDDGFNTVSHHDFIREDNIGEISGTKNASPTDPDPGLRSDDSEVEEMIMELDTKATNRKGASILCYIRRMLWSKLGIYKQAVHRLPWVLMVDFSVALNLEDYYSGSSIMSFEMIEFKKCVGKLKFWTSTRQKMDFTQKMELEREVDGRNT